MYFNFLFDIRIGGIQGNALESNFGGPSAPHSCFYNIIKKDDIQKICQNKSCSAQKVDIRYIYYHIHMFINNGATIF